MKSIDSDGRQKLVSEALVALMVAGGRLIRDLDAACQEHGLTHDQYNLLRILRGAPKEGHPRGEISNRMISRAPDVTRMIDRLEGRGLVARGWHPENRRLSMATITREGLALLEKADRSVAREQARYADQLTREDLAHLRRICRALPE